MVKEAKWAFDETDRRWAEFVKREATDIQMDPVLNSLRLAVGAQEALLNEMILEIDAHVLRSPIEGQVTRIMATPGDFLQAGTLVVQVSPTRTDRVVAYLREDASHVDLVGSRVVVRRKSATASRNEDLEGEVVSLSAVINELPLRSTTTSANNQTWGREVVIVLKDGPILMPGEAVTIRFGSSF